MLRDTYWSAILLFRQLSLMGRIGVGFVGQRRGGGVRARILE
jgi:hypothetical protein